HAVATVDQLADPGVAALVGAGAADVAAAAAAEAHARLVVFAMTGRAGEHAGPRLTRPRDAGEEPASVCVRTFNPWANLPIVLLFMSHGNETIPDLNVTNPDFTDEGGGEHLVGTRLGNYILQEVIGRGGMGIVYRAEHVYIHKPAAVKVLHPRYFDN